ncbi:MAG TPA: MarR family transcriptional regulator [Myxococcaceae bacterium]|nr:MarR family transcriptional regulator [Myxococcaceae bacterium]
MKGILWTGEPPRRNSTPSDPASLTRWEEMAVDAVGNAIEFWGFKRNQGRVWALLYLRGTPMTSGQLERTLGLSKGGVSMLVRDLERWGVVLRVRPPGTGAWKYRAETGLVRMVRRVIEEREGEFLARIRADLGEALRLAQTSGKVSKDKLDRLRKMNQLAEHTERALRAFIKTARLDLGGLFAVLTDRD